MMQAFVHSEEDIELRCSQAQEITVLDTCPPHFGYCVHFMACKLVFEPPWETLIK